MRPHPRIDLLALGLLGLLALAPPETRGHSAWAHGLLGLVFVGASLVLRRQTGSRPFQAIALVGIVGIPLYALALAPGAVPEGWALWAVALGFGFAAASLPVELRRASTLPWCLAGLGAAVGIHGLYQRLFGLDLLAAVLRNGLVGAEAQEWLVRAEGGRAFAAFQTPAAMGGYLILLLPVTAILAYSQRGKLRVVAALAGVLQLVGLASSVSATATAALLGALVIAGLTARSARRGLLIGAVFLLLILGTVAAFRAGEVWDFDNPGNPWVLRAQNIRLATEMSADHPWTGVGLGGFAESYPSYRQPGDNETRFVHNLPMQQVAELGLLPGILATLLFGGCFCRPWWRKTDGNPLWWRGLTLGLLGFAIHNLADFTAYLPSILWTAALLRGWVANPTVTHEKSAGPLLRVLAVVVLLSALAIAVFGAQATALRHDLTLTAASDEGGRRGELATAIRRRAPWSVDAQLLVARARLETIQPGPRARVALREVLVDLDRAVAASPLRPAARRLRAEVRFALGDRPGAYADAVQAARLYPTSVEYQEFVTGMRSRILEMTSP